MPRYKNTKIINNSTEFYEFLRKKKGIKSIRHYATPILYNPGLSSRIATRTTTRVWAYGDRFYKIAAQFYGLPEYWWVIAWWNGTPTEADLTNGSVIEIPLNLEEALTALGAY
jgi:hypothetical protein|tara:strand:- start:9851 stop:10189 length:339 start_codon:yes stop_codon:yes gene_type:complete